MKSIALTILFLFPILVFGQNDNPYNNSIGLNLMYDGNDGLLMSIRLDNKFGNFLPTKFEFSTDTESTFIGRIGIEALRFEYGDKFYITAGLDLSYNYRNQFKFGYNDFHQINLELPIEANFRINSKFTLYGGISFSKSVYTSKLDFNYPTSNKIIRLGAKYNF